MTTHVFIVDENTFKYHLEYLFAGTGSKDNKIDFNNVSWEDSLKPETLAVLALIYRDYIISSDNFVSKPSTVPSFTFTKLTSATESSILSISTTYP